MTTITLTHAVIIVGVLCALAVLWTYTDQQGATTDEGGAPHDGAHHTIADDLANTRSRVIAIETAQHETRLLLDQPRRAPAGVTEDGRLWTLPAGAAPTIEELLDVPLHVGTTAGGELTIDLAALDSLHVAGCAADVHAWLNDQAEQWNWCVATATTRDGVIEVARHNDRPDIPLVVASDRRAQRDLPQLPAAGRIVVDEFAIADAEADSGTWVLAAVNGEWTLSPLQLAITPRFVAHAQERGADEPTKRVAAPSRPRPRRESHVGAHVLGHVGLTGIGDGRQAPKVVELITYLATHPAGATEEELKTTVWETRPAKGRFTNVVSDARRLLGTTASGEPLLPNRHAGRYQLHPSLTTDLQAIADVTGDLEAATGALEAIDGRPFTSALGYGWAHNQGLVEDAIAAIRHAASTVIPHLVAHGEHDRAARVARRCLIAVPLDLTVTILHRDARLAGGDELGARRVEDEYRTATGQRLPERPTANGDHRG